MHLPIIVYLSDLELDVKNTIMNITIIQQCCNHQHKHVPELDVSTLFIPKVWLWLQSTASSRSDPLINRFSPVCKALNNS